LYFQKNLDNGWARFVLAELIVSSAILAWNWKLWPVVAVFLVINVALAYAFVRGAAAGRRIITLKFDEQSVDPTVRIASETLPYMRRGLNVETARKTAEIIQKIGDIPAVAITDRERVLAFIGPGCDRHPPGKEIITFATKQVLATGELKIVQRKEDLQCPVKDCVCPLEGAVIAPLKLRGEVVGTVKLYRTDREGPIPAAMVKLAVGIAQLLGMQMELAELDLQAQLVTKAQLEALRAQINPHFLFNTLNTIIMFSRTDPETARRLLIRLASFFRHAFKQTGHFITLREELECINTYLELEKARFHEKLRVTRDVDKTLLNYHVPVLTLQPLVENAVKHGVMPKMGEGTVHIMVRRVGGEMYVEISDDGVGISPEILAHVFEPGFGSGSGVGLSNVNERLKSLFGPESALRIESKVNRGTRVYFKLPLIKGCTGDEEEGGVLSEAQGLNR